MIYKGKFLVKKERDLDGAMLFVEFVQVHNQELGEDSYIIATSSFPTQFFNEKVCMNYLELLYPEVSFDKCELIDAVITVGGK